MKSKYLRKCPAISGEYGAITASAWGRTSEITSELFDSSGARLPTRYKTLDLPEFHLQSEKGRALIEALAVCEDD